MNLIKQTTLSAIEQAIRLALQQDAPTLKRMQPLLGQRLLLEVEDFQLLILVQVVDDGVLLSLPGTLDECELDDKQDTHVQGPSKAYRRLFEGEGFFDGALRIKGNAQTLMTLHSLMQRFELDWEGLLADQVGDLPASLIAEFLRRKWQWSRHFAFTARQNLVEYLQEESRLLPTRFEMEDMVTDLEHLSMHLDRLEARMRLLHHKLSS